MSKQFIKNRQNQNVSVVVEKQTGSQNTGIVFVGHGLSGNKEQPHVVAIADVLKQAGYVVVTWDATNSPGESDGNPEDATVTNFLEDMESVIEWSKTQPWYTEPFVVCGHSLGGICSLLYAEQHPEEVKALLLLSSVISGELSLEAYGTDAIKEWREKDFYNIGTTTSGEPIPVRWKHMEDRLQYDALKDTSALTMPVLMISGSEDNRALPEHQKILFNRLPSDKKELKTIEGSGHVFESTEEITKLCNIVSEWAENVLNDEHTREVVEVKPPHIKLR